jgi:hypothetical protein
MSANKQMRAFNYIFWLSVLMIAGGFVIMLVTRGNSENLIEFWTIKVKTTQAGVAIMVVGFLGAASVFKKVFSPEISNGGDSQFSPLMTITINVTDKQSKDAITGAIVTLNFPDGLKTSNTFAGSAKFEFPSVYKEHLENIEVTIKKEGYITISQKTDIEHFTVKKFELKKDKNTNITEVNNIIRLLGNPETITDALERAENIPFEGSDRFLFNQKRQKYAAGMNDYDRLNWINEMKSFLNKYCG